MDLFQRSECILTQFLWEAFSQAANTVQRLFCVSITFDIIMNCIIHTTSDQLTFSYASGTGHVHGKYIWVYVAYLHVKFIRRMVIVSHW